MRIGKNERDLLVFFRERRFAILDEEDMPFSRSRSPRFVVDIVGIFRMNLIGFLSSASDRKDSPAVDDRENGSRAGRRSSSRSKSRKKSSKSTRSPKRRSKFD